MITFKPAAGRISSKKTDLANLGRLYRDERLKQKADSMKLENCEKLNRLIGRQRGE